MHYPHAVAGADHVTTRLEIDAREVAETFSATRSAYDRLPAVVEVLTGLRTIDADAPRLLNGIAGALEGSQAISGSTYAEDLGSMTTEGLLALASITEIGHTAIQARYESVVEEIARRKAETRAYGPGSRKLEAAHAHHASNVRLSIFTD